MVRWAGYILLLLARLLVWSIAVLLRTIEIFAGSHWLRGPSVATHPPKADPGNAQYIAATPRQEPNPITLDELDAIDCRIDALRIQKEGLIEQANQTQTGKYKREKLMAQATNTQYTIAKLSRRAAKLREEIEHGDC